MHALLTSLGLVVAATPACSAKFGASRTEGGSNVGSGGGALESDGSAADAATEGSRGDGSTDATASGDDGGDGASDVGSDDSASSDAHSSLDAAQLCCACGNAACCDPGCPNVGD